MLGQILVLALAVVPIWASNVHPVTRQQIPPAPPLPGLTETRNLTFVLSAKNLPNKDFIDAVDPFVKAYWTNASVVEPMKFGSTEVVVDSPNPEFTTVLWFLWKRGAQQKFLFRVRDQDDLQPDDALGEVTISVDDYVDHGESLNVSLSDGGSLMIQKTTPVRFKLYVRNVPKSDPFGGKSDPFVKCYWRRGSNGDKIPFFTTEVVNNVENADFNQTIEFPNYIKGTDQWWTFEVKDLDDLNGNDDLGEALVEVDPFVQNRQTKERRFGPGESKGLLGIVPA